MKEPRLSPPKLVANPTVLRTGPELLLLLASTVSKSPETSSVAIKISAAIKSLSATKASAKSKSKQLGGFTFERFAKLPEPCSSDEFSEYDVSSQEILNMKVQVPKFSGQIHVL